MMRSASLLGIAAALLGACTVGPDYVRPSVNAPSEYKEMDGWKRAEPGDAMVRDKWWEVFRDADLNRLAERVAGANLDIRGAEARVRQSQALVRQVRAGFYPELVGSGSASRARLPGRGMSATSNYELALDATWEADLWGRVRRSVESAVAVSQASVADLESVRLVAQAALVQSYLLLRIADEQRQLLEDTVAALERTLALTRNRYAAGTAAKADVVQAEVQVKSTQADLLDVGVGRAQLEHAIAVLIGEPPARFSIPVARLTTRMPVIPVGVPSELLERRPDIATAERNIAAANAQIGVAQAAFYPSLTLSGAGGFQNSTIADLLATPSRFWTLGALLAQTLFDGGARRAASDEAVAVYDEEVAAYRQTVLAAFQDVEDNLAALRILEEEARVQDEAVRGARESVELTTNQYKAGVVSYLNVIAAQTIALNNERTAVNILGRRLGASVALIRALGGGWSADALAAARRDPS